MDDVSINNENDDNNKWVIKIINQINTLIEKEENKNSKDLFELTTTHSKNKLLLQKNYEEEDAVKNAIQVMRQKLQIQYNDAQDTIINKNNLQELYKKETELKKTSSELVNTIEKLNNKQSQINEKKEKYDNFKTQITDLSKRYHDSFTDYTKVNNQYLDAESQDKRMRIIKYLNDLYSKIIIILTKISPLSAVVTDYKMNEKNNTSNDLFKNKYLKYKMKYITLKKQFI